MLIGVVGLYIRTQVEDTPQFKEAQDRKELSARPLLDAWRNHKKGLLILSGFATGPNVAYYFLFVYLPSYLSSTGLMPYADAMKLNSVSSAVYAISIPIIGWLSDTYNKRNFLIVSCLGFILFSYPMILLHNSGIFWTALAAQVVYALFIGFFIGPMSAVMADLFPTRTRNTSISVGYAWSTAIFGGTAPMVATYLNANGGGPGAVAAYLAVTNVIAIIAVLYCKNE
jgi:MHS family proline/betaine transporter-like MFS transporter